MHACEHCTAVVYSTHIHTNVVVLCCVTTTAQGWKEDEAKDEAPSESARERTAATFTPGRSTAVHSTSRPVVTPTFSDKTQWFDSQQLTYELLDHSCTHKNTKTQLETTEHIKTREHCKALLTCFGAGDDEAAHVRERQARITRLGYK